MFVQTCQSRTIFSPVQSLESNLDSKDYLFKQIILLTDRCLDLKSGQFLVDTELDAFFDFLPSKPNHSPSVIKKVTDHGKIVEVNISSNSERIVLWNPKNVNYEITYTQSFRKIKCI